MSTDPGEAIIEAAREMEEAEGDFWLFFRRRGKRGNVLMRTGLCDLPLWLVKGVDRGEIVMKLVRMKERYSGRLK